MLPGYTSTTRKVNDGFTQTGSRQVTFIIRFVSSRGLALSVAMCSAALLTPNTRLSPSLEMVVSNDCMVHEHDSPALSILMN